MNTATSKDPLDIAKRVYEAFVTKDRDALEALIADDFHFTSPRDNRLDRATFFSRCWPSSRDMDAFTFVHLVRNGDCVFVTYDLRMKNGSAFRNTEILTLRDDKVIEAQVFFGWALPHEAPEGGYI